MSAYNWLDANLVILHKELYVLHVLKLDKL